MFVVNSSKLVFLNWKLGIGDASLSKYLLLFIFFKKFCLTEAGNFALVLDFDSFGVALDTPPDFFQVRMSSL